ncbi:MAG: hypothetical protein ACI8UO_001849 [Verrucomicrobiales bacterium]|jgi:hypothetical protein
MSLFSRRKPKIQTFEAASPEVTFIYTYYNQIDMLRNQLETWRNYPEGVRNRIRFMLVDDCSRRTASELVGNPNIDLSIYRILEDKYCNIGGARNLGTKACETKWMLHSDMDHVIPAIAAEAMLKLASLDDRKIYKFKRIDHTTGETKIHPGTMLLTPDVYWEVGGCDEDFVGNYGQTDIHFFHRADKIIETDKREDIQMEIHHEGETKEIDRSKLEPNRQLFEEKKTSGAWSTDFLRFEWEKQR